MSELSVQNLTKKYGAVAAIEDVSLAVRPGEFLTLLGPSGCGKSTTLFSIAGLDRPTSGEIRVNETVFFDSATGRHLPPEKRNCGLVFQSYALWPHMTVAENVEFPLRIRRVGRRERKERALSALALVEMEDYAARYPHELSGGQQQRVALARTLAFGPSLLLLDEPLSNLDAKLRIKARAWLKDLQRRLGITTIYVTHDQSEALALSDRIAVMNRGRIVQLATPREIYTQPANSFVADFIGSSNFLNGRAVRSIGTDLLEIAVGGGQKLIAASPGPVPCDHEVMIAIRPEYVQLLDLEEPSPSEVNLLEATVRECSYLGARNHYALEVGGVFLAAESAREFEQGARVRATFDAQRAVVLSE